MMHGPINIRFTSELRLLQKDNIEVDYTVRAQEADTERRVTGFSKETTRN